MPRSSIAGVVRLDQQDVARRGDGRDHVEVERDLLRPARRPAPGSRCRRVWSTLRKQPFAAVQAGSPYCCAVDRQVGLGGRVVVGVDDGDGLAGAAVGGQVVGGPQVGGRVAARRRGGAVGGALHAQCPADVGAAQREAGGGTRLGGTADGFDGDLARRGRRAGGAGGGEGALRQHEGEAGEQGGDGRRGGAADPAGAEAGPPDGSRRGAGGGSGSGSAPRRVGCRRRYGVQGTSPGVAKDAGPRSVPVEDMCGVTQDPHVARPWSTRPGWRLTAVSGSRPPAGPALLPRGRAAQRSPGGRAPAGRPVCEGGYSCGSRPARSRP